MLGKRLLRLSVFLMVLASVVLACGIQPKASGSAGINQVIAITPTSAPVATPTDLTTSPVNPGTAHPDEPTSIIGKIPYTYPFFENSISEPFVMLEDEAGFVKRDHEFQFPLADQIIGPVTVQEDKSLNYEIALPAVPQGTFVDVDNNGKKNTGVQVFQIAYWSNTWGGPFLEERDGTGWSDSYSSATVDPDRHEEINGGTLIVWAPDDQQSFPTGFGADNKLFTEDDPVAPIPAGYNLVDLSQKPFKFYKQARPNLDLNEGDVALNDYSKLSYTDAFENLFKKASREYPFTKEKNVDWQAIYAKIQPEVKASETDQDFYQAIHDFTNLIPDEHVGVQIDPQVFYQQEGGGFGLILAELSDGRVIVTDVLNGSPAEKAGIQRGAEITTWNNKPVKQALDEIVPFLGPYSTQQARRIGQLVFLTRVPPNSSVSVSYKDPNEAEKQATMEAMPEYDSLFKALGWDKQQILPIEASILQPSGLGYIRINTFSDNYHLMAQLWERYIQEFNDQKVPGIIIDLRNNSGGNGGLANDFAGYFFKDSFEQFRGMYFNNETDKFEYQDVTEKIKPAPMQYSGPIAVLVSPECVSACELFSYTLKHDGRSMIIGNFPTAGAAGEVSRGQYKLPGGLSMQLPTGRPETLDGKVPIEGVGVTLDVTVPVTEKSALGEEDGVLQAAIQALQQKLK